VLLNHYDTGEAVDEGVLQENRDRCLVLDFAQESRVAAASVLQTLELNLLQNGHVDFGVNSYDCDCTIWLTEHKTFNIVTQDQALHRKLRRLLATETNQVDELESFANVYGHYHYRPPGSLSEEMLVAWLESAGWQLQQTID